MMHRIKNWRERCAERRPKAAARTSAEKFEEDIALTESYARVGPELSDLATMPRPSARVRRIIVFVVRSLFSARANRDEDSPSSVNVAVGVSGVRQI